MTTSFFSTVLKASFLGLFLFTLTACSSSGSDGDGTTSFSREMSGITVAFKHPSSFTGVANNDSSYSLLSTDLTTTLVVSVSDPSLTLEDRKKAGSSDGPSIDGNASVYQVLDKTHTYVTIFNSKEINFIYKSPETSSANANTIINTVTLD